MHGYSSKWTYEFDALLRDASFSIREVNVTLRYIRLD